MAKNCVSGNKWSSKIGYNWLAPYLAIAEVENSRILNGFFNSLVVEKVQPIAKNMA